MILVDVLVVSDKYDFTTDFICIELEKREMNYLRLNRDEFHQYKIHLDTRNFDIHITISGREYIVTKEYLKSIYYRAPIFLRGTEKSIEDQLYSEQWMAFVRNLLIFEEVTWINNPEKTYKAENKIVQLKYAKKTGFNIPHTIVTNTSPALSKDNYVVKSLDTAFFHIEENEGFIYSNIFEKDKIQKANLEWAPVTIQDYVFPKIDIRVTVIEDDVFATSITSNGRGVKNDWRKAKDEVAFKTFSLPKDIENKCIRLVKELDLKFGAIDLLKTEDGNFIFLEVNPTGEWAWLVHTTGQTIPQSITDKLVNF
ncbi:RimK-like ATP-grasp domain-containing protein [Gracilibacillus orientalis]|uniref:RimK-like ATP-grasp domain-containing protein n=1 Tax=Gracilibacillus orientalis TaxID=334253 RepID=A0A1I4J4D5_9BACI|nr:hypothetical protein [Gracilibacillus orientalis]SFL61409.1 RimK-like ATP-grasp domain-containing protein [Gracilibacillus orientalis]